jgi:hypothetical protein
MIKPPTNLATSRARQARDRYATSSPYAAINPTRRNKQKRGLRVLDGNSPEAHFIRRCTKRLIDDHFNGNVSTPQRALISKIAWIELRCTLLDRKLIDNRETPYDQDTYLAHTGKLMHLYGKLGIEKPKKSFAELLQKP